jgi:hypothetical protein
VPTYFWRNEKDVWETKKEVLSQYKKDFGIDWFKSERYKKETFDPFWCLVKKNIKKNKSGCK